MKLPATLILTFASLLLLAGCGQTSESTSLLPPLSSEPASLPASDPLPASAPSQASESIPAASSTPESSPPEAESKQPPGSASAAKPEQPNSSTEEYAEAEAPQQPATGEYGTEEGTETLVPG